MTEKKSNMTKILVSLTEKELELFDRIKTDGDFRSRSATIAHVLKKYAKTYNNKKTNDDVDFDL